jgi:ribonucleoside-diphosphate reductase alpha chain
MEVIKHDGTKEEFSWIKVEEFYKRVNYGYNTKCPFSAIKENLTNYIVDDISTEDVNKMIIKSAVDLISPQNVLWQNIAGRMMMKNLYKQWSRATGMAHGEKYSGDYFLSLLSNYTERGLYNKALLEKYSIQEIKELSLEMKEDYDMDYVQSTVGSYISRYLLNRKETGIMELPQHMYMANAMFL